MSYSIAVLGNVNIDLVFAPLPQLPHWGQEYFVPNAEPRTAGAAGYTAMALAQCGLANLLVGAIGNDPWGGYIHQSMTDFPLIDLSGLEINDSQPTGLCVALVDGAGNRAFVSSPAASASVDAAFLARQEKRLLRARYLLICGYFFMPLLRGEALAPLLRRARQRGIQVLLDTGWDPDNWPDATRQEVLSLLKEVDFFLPNLDEARALTGASSPADCARILLAKGAPAVAIKLGNDGGLWLDESGLDREPARPITAYDTTGAGDAFNAALIYGLQQNWDKSHILTFANALCSLVISRRQHRYPSLHEVMAILDH